MDTYSIRRENLRSLIRESHSQAEFAAACGTAPSVLSLIVSPNPKRNLGDKLARKIEAAQGLPHGWLDTPQMVSNFDSNIEPALGPTRYFEYPEISWVQAGAAVEAMELSNIAACERHPSDAWAGPNGFWLKVRGPSMTSEGGVSFIDGMVILVAPGFDVENGHFVVAKTIDTNEATFKQLILDSRRAFLKPLNPFFPTIEMDDEWTIVGRVIDAKWPRSTF